MQHIEEIPFSSKMTTCKAYGNKVIDIITQKSQKNYNKCMMTRLVTVKNQL